MAKVSICPKIINVDIKLKDDPDELNLSIWSLCVACVAYILRAIKIKPWLYSDTLRPGRVLLLLLLVVSINHVWFGR